MKDEGVVKPYRVGDDPELDTILAQEKFVPTKDTPWKDVVGIELLMPRDMAQEIAKLAEKKVPADWLTWNQVGGARFVMGDIEGALQACHKAIDMHRSAMTLFQLGAVLDGIGRFDEAIEIVDEAWHMDANRQFLGLLYSQALLRQGRWEEGWKQWRRYMSDFEGKIYDIDGKVEIWRGQPLLGNRILVLPDGGYGDNILFFAWIKNLHDQGAHVTFACPPSLGTLLEGHPWIDEIFPVEAWEVVRFMPQIQIDDNNFDYCVAIMNIPAWLDVPLPYVPATYIHAPYIHAKNPRMRVRNGKQLVGLAWKAQERFESVRKRSLEESQARQLADIDCVEWVNLQYGAAKLNDRMIDPQPSIGDWEDTVDVIAGLDLVVTVDTSVAHVAGAMGKPVWIMLDQGSDWKWMTEGEHSVFYPTALLLRSQNRGIQDAVDDAASRLQEIDKR